MEKMIKCKEYGFVYRGFFIEKISDENYSTNILNQGTLLEQKRNIDAYYSVRMDDFLLKESIEKVWEQINP